MLNRMARITKSRLESSAGNRSHKYITYIVARTLTLLAARKCQNIYVTDLTAIWPHQNARNW